MWHHIRVALPPEGAGAREGWVRRMCERQPKERESPERWLWRQAWLPCVQGQGGGGCLKRLLKVVSLKR